MNSVLAKQLKELKRNPVFGISVGLVDDANVFEWQIVMVGPENTLFEGGVFNAVMSFPREFPTLPPSLRFTTELWHPNIYPDGRVCISILHPPGEDRFSDEKAEERWLPVRTVESILLSVVAMLSDPNDSSPANVDAAKQWRENRDEFSKKVKHCVKKSLEW